MFDPPHKPCTVMPVISSGQTALHAHDTFETIGTDLLFMCGGGIIGHPQGPAAGVSALRQAWDAARAGESLQSAGARHPELASAMETFG
jgi:ribulose-bisphosphate carboxylase large chain